MRHFHQHEVGHELDALGAGHGTELSARPICLSASTGKIAKVYRGDMKGETSMQGLKSEIWCSWLKVPQKMLEQRSSNARVVASQATVGVLLEDISVELYVIGMERAQLLLNDIAHRMLVEDSIITSPVASNERRTKSTTDERLGYHGDVFTVEMMRHTASLRNAARQRPSRLVMTNHISIY